MVSQRVYLFHGSDSLASSNAVRQWEVAFKQKHGELLLHRLHADELDPREFLERLQNLTQAQGLFSESTLVIVKRATKREKGSSGEYTNALKQVLSKKLPDYLTVVVWEETLLSDSHALLKWFKEQVEASRAVVKTFVFSSLPVIMRVVEAKLQEAGLSLEKEAHQSIHQQLQALEKKQRLAKQLKTQDVLAQDERGWWIAQLTERLILTSSGRVNQQTLLEVMETMVKPVSLFEVVNAITSRQYKRARELLSLWERDDEEDAQYFRLIHLLRREAKRSVGSSLYSRYLLKLLAEFEILAKNGFLTPQVGIDLVCIKLATASKDQLSPIIAERKLWLASLRTSGN
jgi:hypothetical protein